jgi:alpha-galactosidase
MAEGKTNWNRREAIGLTVATTLVLAGCAKAARGPGGPGGGIANRGTILEAGDAGAKALHLTSLRNKASGFEWLAGEQTLSPSIKASTERKAPWKPLPSSGKPDTLAIRAGADDGLQAELDIVAFADTGAFRWQQAYRNSSAAALDAIRGASALDLALRGDVGDLVLHCVRRDSDYFREALPFRGHLQIGGGAWNAPAYTGLIIIEATEHAEFLILGVQHERNWILSLDSQQGRTHLRVALEDMETRLQPGQRFEAPPIYIGACDGALDDAVNLSLSHLRTRILPKPQANAPWVSYDIWSTDGANVEKNIHDEIRFAADLGIELFYLDASWYKNSSRKGLGDWGKGIGSYEEDRLKFPRGLRYLSDQVHAAGMKFGLWVGPNIVDEDLVPAMIPEKWLAQVDGKRAELNIPNWENTVVQVCLGSPEYTEHLKKELTRLVGEYNLDWIKWDNSGIPALPARCNRADHGHAAGDGSAAALANEYAIFEHLHDEFPQLTLEQCGYGSRLDLGRAAWVRANWCSDTTFPSERVRSNAMACATVFPSGCNAAWIVREDKEFFGYEKSYEIDAGIRSRMVGLFGVGTLNGQMSQRASQYPQPVIERLKANIATYKQFRHLLMQQVSYPFQPYGRSPQGWEAMQFTDDTAGEAVVLCFRGASSQAASLVRLGRLRPDVSYRVRRLDAATEERLTGKELMSGGLLLELANKGASEILHLKAEG